MAERKKQDDDIDESTDTSIVKAYELYKTELKKSNRLDVMIKQAKAKAVKADKERIEANAKCNHLLRVQNQLLRYINKFNGKYIILHKSLLQMERDYKDVLDECVDLMRQVNECPYYQANNSDGEDQANDSDDNGQDHANNSDDNGEDQANSSDNEDNNDNNNVMEID